MFTRDSSLDVKSRKDVPFGGLNDVLLNFGGKSPQKLYLFIYTFFSETRVLVRPADGFLRAIAAH